MSNVRIYGFAKELGVTNKRIIIELSKLGITDKTHSSSIDEETADKIEQSLLKMGVIKAPRQKKKAEAPKKTTAKKAAAKKTTAKKKTAKKAAAEAEKKAKEPAQKQAGTKSVEAEKKVVEHEPAKPVQTKGEAPKKEEAVKKGPPKKPEAKKKKHEKKQNVSPDTIAKAEALKRALEKKSSQEGRPSDERGSGARRGQKRPFSSIRIKTSKETQAKVEGAVDDGKLLPEEVAVMKVPDRFKKDIESEKMEKFKAKPGMQRAFQSIRKVEPRRWQESRGGKKQSRDRGSQFKAEKAPPSVTAPRKKTLKLPEGATVKEFAEVIGVKVPDIIKKFMDLGIMPTINEPVDMDAALLVADGFGIKIEPAAVEDVTVVEEAPEDEANLEPRPPVITIMGHVDHGKTSLLDAIRSTKVTETEFGGITQHIGAYKVSLKGKDIVFLDTPGHEAFTSMRARGAKVTDIVVLVVAADDGVKPQTIEAIDHAKAAGVPIIVAVNKIDKPEANVQQVLSELSAHGILSEAWGGHNIVVEVSAKQRIGIENLLEMILLQADIMELKANPNKMANGVIIEAKLDKGRGPVATVLIQAGTLKVGDIFLSGNNTGRARALIDDDGKRLEHVGPSTPVEVIGFGSVPQAGDVFLVMEDERKARQIAMARLNKQKASEMKKAGHLTLDEVYSKIKEGQMKDLNIVIKADVQGSVEAMKDSLESITHEEVKVSVIHSAVGGISESDVMLAAASDAIIIGFNVRPDTKASNVAKAEGVDIRLYTVIYEAIEDVKKALEGLLEPTLKERVLGRAEVRQTFAVSRLGTIAGCYVTDGIMSRASDGIRVIRDNIVIYESKLASLKRFKEDVKEVSTGYECGIMVENYNDLKEGDIIENFVIEKVAAKL